MLNTNLISQEIQEAIKSGLESQRKVTFLVGAGLSAESGIPTFRDKDGFWTVGSANYTPQEMGTKKMFDTNSGEVWRWYLYRIAICKQAKPNQGHVFLSKIERLLGDRFSLISQNVDGLHFDPISYVKNTFLIHGDLRFMRCSDECSKSLYEIPSELTDKYRSEDIPMNLQDFKLLKCPKCGLETRPHVLWFDEYYNDVYYHLHKVLRIAKETGLLFIVGTSGATTLPQRIVESTISRQGIVVDINPNDNLFSNKLERVKKGYRIKSRSSEVLSHLHDLINKTVSKR